MSYLSSEDDCRLVAAAAPETSSFIVSEIVSTLSTGTDGGAGDGMGWASTADCERDRSDSSS